MGEPEGTVKPTPEENVLSEGRPAFQSRLQPESAAFHTQLGYLPEHQPYLPQHVGPYRQPAFDTMALAAALPLSAQQQFSTAAPNVRMGALGVMPPFNAQHMPQYPAGRHSQFGPAAAAKAQQQHYAQVPYMPIPQPPLMPPQQPSMSPQYPMPLHAQGQNIHMVPYNFPPNSAGFPIDPRFPPSGPMGVGVPVEFAQSGRRRSEPGPVPSFPRGPPRKPKQSGHALWVGNLPPAASVADLKNHFSRDATKDIESIFLISKSNCAFVNYRSEAACIAAMNRFDDSRFHGVRLVCRLRKGSNVGVGQSVVPPAADKATSNTPSNTTSSSTSNTASQLTSSVTSNITPSNESPASLPVIDAPMSPTILRSPSPSTAPLDSEAVASPDRLQRKGDRYFIVKSLTVQDLEASVRKGIWATQSHNESTLNRAYEQAENVYLIFSANKSGEYFGYAKMTSMISGERVNLGSSATPDGPISPGAPQSIPTPATATAPKGRIIDDSARDTIFWEAEHSDDEDGSPQKESNESFDGQNWGRQFSVDWLSTSQLPFHRTRGLRNSWNANREVKIARDGTELEPSVGKRLVEMFDGQQPPLAPNLVGLPPR